MRATAVSRLYESRTGKALLRRNNRPRAGIKLNRSRAGGTGLDASDNPPAVVSVPDEVFKVSVAETGFAPGVTVVGDRKPEQFFGSPE
jgi:hypothetical protein